MYSAEQQGRTPRPVTLEGPRLALYEAVRNVCEWRLGRADLAVGGTAGDDEPLEPKRVDEIVSCLKRIRKSAQGWTKRAGARDTCSSSPGTSGSAAQKRQRPATGSLIAKIAANSRTRLGRRVPGPA